MLTVDFQIFDFDPNDNPIVNSRISGSQCPIGTDLKNQIFLLFNLFLLLFIGHIALFDTNNVSHCTVSTTF